MRATAFGLRISSHRWRVHLPIEESPLRWYAVTVIWLLWAVIAEKRGSVENWENPAAVVALEFALAAVLTLSHLPFQQLNVMEE